MPKILRLLLAILLALAIAFVGTFYFTRRSVDADATSASGLADAKESAEPLVRALENYRAKNGLYPVSVDQIPVPNRLFFGGRNGILYSARRMDWVFKDDACRARVKSLPAWTENADKSAASQVADFERDCVTGFRYYQLQSGDFPTAAPGGFLQSGVSNSVERWAYYDAGLRQWSIGWCRHGNSKTSTEFSENGVCRWRGNTPAPW